MKVQSVFGSSVITHKCDDESIYKNEIFYNKLIESLCLADQLSSFLYANTLEAIGKTQCTAGNLIPNYLKPHFIQNNEKLFEWLYAKFMESSKYYVNFEPTDLKLIRCWSNLMYKGSSGKVHNHYAGENLTHCVGVFYVDCPPNSADIVFVEDKQGDYVTDYDEKSIHSITPRAGELIIHNPIMHHGVSEHKNDEPRICIIIDVQYV